MKSFFLTLGGLFIVIAVIFITFRLNPSKQTKQIIQRPAALPKEVTIALDTNGFTPSSVTVTVGTAVRWKNITDEKQTVNSDDYPTNQLHKELNFGIFNASSSVVYVFKTPGSYGYHNQFHPEQKGKVIVMK